MDKTKQLDPETEPMVKEENFLDPVPPLYVGQGFPYAPTDWPNPGDTWGWKVGKRITSFGYYSDRFLIPPSSLQKRSCPRYFASRCSLEQYILKEFPDADIDAFFASFVWRIPSTLWHSAKVGAASLSLKKIEEQGTKESPVTVTMKRKHTAASSLAKRQTRQSLGRSSLVISKDTDDNSCSLNDEAETPGKDMRTTLDVENDQPGSDFVEGNDSDVKTMPENFNSYIDSLDDILAQPLSEASFTNGGTICRSTLEEELAEAQSKLSTLLDTDFPSLVSSKNIYELIQLASNLRKDPNLSAESLQKLKLIEEIPSYGKVFVENRRITEQAKNFFAVLENKKAKAHELKKEYSETKEKIAQLQIQLDSDTLAVKELDDQIAKLQSLRAELMSKIGIQEHAQANLNNEQQQLVNAIQKVVGEVQVANSKKEEWELKKENAAKHEAEILAKFDPLKGFSL